MIPTLRKSVQMFQMIRWSVDVRLSTSSGGVLSCVWDLVGTAEPRSQNLTCLTKRSVDRFAAFKEVNSPVAARISFR